MGKWRFCQDNIHLKEVAWANSSLSASLGAPSPDDSAFALCIWSTTFFQTASFTNCALLALHPSLLCFRSDITLSRQTETPFTSLLIVINDGKEKTKTTHSLLNSSQNITLSNLPLVNDNHKEWTKPTDRIKKQHSFLFDLRNHCRAGLRVL